MYYADASSKNILNELFDLQASLQLQLNQRAFLRLKLSQSELLDDIADEVAEKVGRRPSQTTLWRLQNGIAVRPNSIYGLRETEIAWTFFTSTHIAEDAQRAELDLRITKFSGGKMEEAIARTSDAVKRLKDRLARRTCHEREDEDVRLLDQAAVASLLQQINLYRAALPDVKDNKEMRKHLLLEAQRHGLQVLWLLRAQLRGASGDQGYLIIGARAAINTLFAVFTLDGHEAGGPLTEWFVRRYGTPWLFRAAFECATATRDPRLAHYFAELAILLPHRRCMYDRGINLKVEAPASDPLITSARFLLMSRKLDGEETTAINDWHPRWLEGRIDQIDEAQELIAQAERSSLVLN